VANLFISYDLHNPGQHYERVATAIKHLGSWAKVQKSYWYLSTNLTAKQVADAVWKVMDTNDSLFVVDATNNDAACYGVDQQVGKFMSDHWQNRAQYFR
jgi:hypothetical protein